VVLFIHKRKTFIFELHVWARLPVHLHFSGNEVRGLVALSVRLPLHLQAFHEGSSTRQLVVIAELLQRIGHLVIVFSEGTASVWELSGIMVSEGRVVLLLVFFGVVRHLVKAGRIVDIAIGGL